MRTGMVHILNRESVIKVAHSTLPKKSLYFEHKRETLLFRDTIQTIVQRQIHDTVIFF